MTAEKTHSIKSAIDRSFHAVANQIKKGQFTNTNLSLDTITELKEMSVDKLSGDELEQVLSSFNSGVNHVFVHCQNCYIPTYLVDRLNNLS